MSSSKLFNSSTSSPPTSTKGISISGWEISSTRGTIASSNSIDSITNTLAIPLPEMPFPNNSLTIKHHKSGFNYTFDGNRALASIEGVNKRIKLEGLDLRDQPEFKSDAKRKVTTGLGEKPKSKGIKVAYANQWGKSRDAFGAVPTSSTNPNPNPPPSTDPDPSTFPSATSSHFGPEVALAAAQSGIDSTRHYDWTYSTTWPGVEGTDRPLDLETEPTETSKEESKSRHEAEGRIFKEGNPREDRIPTERLVPGPNAEPILFYDDLVLFEDELADNGSSVLRVKVRVMPSCFLVLQRFFLRVDDVLFRIFDTRIWVDFQSAPPGQLPSTSIPSMAPTSNPSTGSNGVPWANQASRGGGTTGIPRNVPTPSSIGDGLKGLNLGPTRKELKGSSKPDGVTSAGKSLAERNAGDENGQIKIIRECSGSQAKYSEVKSFLPPWKAQDLSPLTEENWVYQTLKTIKETEIKKSLQSSSTSGHKSKGLESVLNRAREEVSPARVPLENDGRFEKSAEILGQVDERKLDEEEILWEGCGERIDVAVLKFK